MPRKSDEYQRVVGCKRVFVPILGSCHVEEGQVSWRKNWGEGSWLLGYQRILLLRRMDELVFR